MFKRYATIAAAALVLVVVSSVAATAVLAERPPTTTPTATAGSQPNEYTQVFLGKLAAALGIDQQKLEAALKSAGKATVDEGVANGKLTQAQADKMKEAIDTGAPTFWGLRGMAKKGAEAGVMREGRFIQEERVILDAVAAKLGMSSEDLKTELRSGKTILDIAKAKGVSEADLKNAAAAAMKTDLDKLVSEGKITQTQADAILQRVKDAPLFNLMAHGGPMGKGPRR